MQGNEHDAAYHLRVLIKYLISHASIFDRLYPGGRYNDSAVLAKKT